VRSTTRPARPSLRIATYNILLGAERREALVTDVLRRIDADVVALQEVSRPEVAVDIAAALGMRVMIGEPSDPGAPHLALLTRLPVVEWRNRRHAGRMLRSNLHCTVETGSDRLRRLRVHCVHLAARFGERAKGEARRMRELTAILSDIAIEPPLPHVLAGDFNALSPGDPLAATEFFQRMNRLRRAGLIDTRPDGYVGPVAHGDQRQDDVDEAWIAAGVDPRLQVGIPVLPRIIGPLTAQVPVHGGIDRMLGRFIERWTTERVHQEGYVDCYRRMHRTARGFTCATWSPAARIDYVFATKEVARTLTRCDVVGSRTWPDPDASIASDHFPLVADFGL